MDDQITKPLKAILDAASREPILTTREATHGNYLEVAEFAQHLKDIFRTSKGWGNLTVVQRESLDLNCTKYARIMCGNPDTKDHWDDVAGYAKLVSETL